jgi:type II secretory pathway pseudopilin PulG
MDRRSAIPATAFTLLELLVVSVLMAAISLIVAQMWRYFSVDLTDLGARARAAQELRLAVESLQEDMGSAVAATRMSDSHVLICKDGPPDYDGVPWNQQDVQVEYYLSEGKLVRYDHSTAAEMTIASDVADFAVADLSPSLLEMVIQVQRSGLSRQVTLRWSRP